MLKARYSSSLKIANSESNEFLKICKNTPPQKKNKQKQNKTQKTKKKKQQTNGNPTTLH